MNIFIKGLNGCWMRQTDLRRYRDLFIANGHILVDHPANADLVLLWTCAFRRDFRDNSIFQIDLYQKKYKAEIIVAGCLPDIDQDLLQKHFNGKVLNWRDDDSKFSEFFSNFDMTLNQVKRVVSESKLCDDVAEYRRQYPDKPASFADQFIKIHISEGCRFECAYCSELLAFPPYRSFPESEILAACRREIETSGNKDIMLLGDSIGDYGHDFGSSLPRLIRQIKTIDPAVTVSLHGLNPAHFRIFFDEMADLISQGNIKHISLPIQSASERILQLMNRAYSRADIENIFTLFATTGFTGFETHLIIGFPGETEDDFQQSLDFMLKHKPRYVLVSGFMESPGAPAALLPDKVSTDVMKQRLREAEKQIRTAGIICNTDDSTLSMARFHSLNHTP